LDTVGSTPLDDAVRFIPVETLAVRFGGGRLGDAAGKANDDGTLKLFTGDPAARFAKDGFGLARRWLMDPLEGADSPSEP
jgi:hypothetical protein